MPYEAVTVAQLCVGGAIELSSFTFLILLSKGCNTVETCILIQKLVRNTPFLSYVASGKDHVLLISWSRSEWVVWRGFKLQLLSRWSVGLDLPSIRSEINSERNNDTVSFSSKVFKPKWLQSLCFVAFRLTTVCFLSCWVLFSGSGDADLWGAAFVESLIIPSGQSVWHSVVTFQPPPPPKVRLSSRHPLQSQQTCLYLFSLFCC